MTQLTLHVEGMGCRRCVREVTARLRDVDGVETVAAHHGTLTVRLSGVMSAEDVMRAFVGTSYVATILADTEETGIGQQPS